MTLQVMRVVDESFFSFHRMLNATLVTFLSRNPNFTELNYTGNFSGKLFFLHSIGDRYFFYHQSGHTLNVFHYFVHSLITLFIKDRSFF